MISDVHYVELYINKQLIELESQDSLNLRINNTLFVPTKTSTVQSEYSYSFDIPSTPNNDRILGYANNLSKLNKFHARYPAEVYADGELIFDGSLTIQKYNAKDKMYSCNLVNIKINTLEEIFGDAVMTDINNWNVPFSGAPTINSVNDDPTTNYFFPLVSYGVFQKEFVTKDEVAATYTPKHDLDRYNKWWVESFYPSLNVLETMKKAFEWKGYTVGGSAFSDPLINWIYASCNLASEQMPVYNLGNPKFGKVELNLAWTGAVTTSSTSWSQDLRLPYFPVGGNFYDFVQEKFFEPEYNYKDVLISPLLKEGNVSYSNDTYMVDPNEHLIVIPADGWYKVSLSGQTSLLQTNNITARQYVCHWNSSTTSMSLNTQEEVITFSPDFTITTPLEIQLIRNYDENLELIKGKNNISIRDGNPDHKTECNMGRFTNYYNYQTCYPHEAAGPTMLFTYCTNRNVIMDTASNTSDASIGYIYHDGTVMCYDPVVSPSFICGWTTMGNKNGGGTTAFLKDGRSWSREYLETTDTLYEQEGYDRLDYVNGLDIESTPTRKNYNSFNNAPTPTFYMPNPKSCIAKVEGMIYLKKNDRLELVAVRRGYWNNGNEVTYAVTANINLTIEAATPKTKQEIKTKNYGWYSPTEFPDKLNLFEFTNKETKVSDWISNIQKAFNLELVMDANNVQVNTNKGVNKNITYAINIDDRVSSDEAESEYISYPKEMSVQYKIDTDEWGFELTVPPEHINDEGDTWKKWGDSGFTVIKLNDDTYETSTQNTSTNFSYTYYDNFNWKEVSSDGAENSGNTVGITIPVIEKAEYMAEGYGYDEAMKHDGYSMTQRFWYRQPRSEEYVWLSSVLASGNKESVYLTYPINSRDGFNLSYKDTEKSIATEYFNIYPMLSSNYVNVECYLTPEEYKNIKGGALVHFDSDLYYCSQISGYDPSGSNLTTLKLIKRV